MALKRSPTKGFTLLELLVVLAIMSVLIGLIASAVQRVRGATAQLECANKLKQLGLACHSFQSAHGRLPPAFGFFPKADIYSGTAGLGTVFFHLLPFVEQRDLYQNARHRTDDTPRQDFFLYTAGGTHQRQVALFNCPSDPSLSEGVDATTSYAPSSYAANYLVFGVVDKEFRHCHAGGKARVPGSFADGTSQTVLFAEKYARARIAAEENGGAGYEGGCQWAHFQAEWHNALFAFYFVGETDPHSVGPYGRLQIQPSAQRCNPCLPASGHGSMNACLADGSVRGLTAEIEGAQADGGNRGAGGNQVCWLQGASVSDVGMILGSQMIRGRESPAHGHSGT